MIRLPEPVEFPVVTLCGSTRFRDDFVSVNQRLHLGGCVAFTVSCFQRSGDPLSPRQKQILDRGYFRKIMLSDAVFVLNRGGYIGLSAMDEIWFALSRGLPVMFLEKPKPECLSMFEGIAGEREHPLLRIPALRELSASCLVPVA